jgi:hypothetical protein
MKRFWIRRGFSFLIFGFLFVGLAGWTVMALWNALLPDILGVSVITFWQALGLLVLSRILFGGYGFRGRGGYGRTNPGQGQPGRMAWKEKMTERWQSMTPEQREQMKQQWRDKCGPWGRAHRGRRGQAEPPDPNEPANQ